MEFTAKETRKMTLDALRTEEMEEMLQDIQERIITAAQKGYSEVSITDIGSLPAYVRGALEDNGFKIAVWDDIRVYWLEE